MWIELGVRAVVREGERATELFREQSQVHRLINLRLELESIRSHDRHVRIPWIVPDCFDFGVVAVVGHLGRQVGRGVLPERVGMRQSSVRLAGEEGNRVDQGLCLWIVKREVRVHCCIAAQVKWCARHLIQSLVHVAFDQLSGCSWVEESAKPKVEGYVFGKGHLCA